MKSKNLHGRIIVFGRRFLAEFSVLLCWMVLICSVSAENNSNYIFNGTPGAFTTLNIPMTSPGTNDSLQILNGGSVAVSGNSFIGPNASDKDNYVVVTGTNLLGVASSLTTVGDLYLGQYGSGNQLIITNVGVVSDAHGFVGYQVAGASNNTILVSGSGSVWSNSNYMILGDTGNGNSLTIANGGRVDALYVLAGYSDNNTAFVTGSNSLWSLPTSSLEWGLTGTNNVLTISNGGTVRNSDGYIGYFYSSGNHNGITVTDPGSVWSNSSIMYVGYAGQNSFLTITNGGKVYNTSGTVGQTVTGTNSTILVDGVGSLWNNNGTFQFGTFGGSNSMVISNGGRVNAAGTYTILGVNSVSSGNNSVLVTGAGSTWSNSSYMIEGDTGGNNQITIANSGRVDVLYFLEGYSDDNKLTVTGPGSVLSLPTSSFEVGLGGNNNIATIADGGSVVAQGSYISAAVGAATNSTVVVTAAVLTNSGSMNVGYTGGYGRLIVTNGGKVYNTASFIGGTGPSYTNAGNNLVLISDPGSSWNNSDVLYVGYYAGQNSLIVSNGAFVSSVAAPSAVSGWIGYYGGSTSSNQVVVTGTASQWTNSGAISIGGSSGQGNSLVVSGGGRVDATYALMGYYGVSQGNNSVLVTGSNSLLNLYNSTYGYMETVYGTNNSITIVNGGRVNDTVAYIGDLGSKEIVTVSGAGSIWSNSSTLYLGYSASYGNQMTISGGARVENGQAQIGGYAGVATETSNNVVVVTDPGSVWNNSGVLYMGLASPNNQLIISNGAYVASAAAAPTSPSAFVGYTGASSNNLVVVTGTGSIWTNTGGMYLGGGAGPGNRMVISDGGRVDATFVYMGYTGQSGGNDSLLITGSNSLLNIASGSAGYFENVYGPNDTITISNGGRMNVIGNLSYIGGTTSASNTVMTVTGAGSVVSNSGSILLGYASSSNRLEISDGAQVADVAAYIGGFASPSAGNNLVVVTGPTTAWTNSDIIYAGYKSTGNQLVISNGARVVSTQGVIGYNDPSVSNNSVVVTGAGSQWSNTLTSTYGVTVGVLGSSNALTIADGGRVDSAYGFVGYGTPGGPTYGYGNLALITGSNSLWNIKNYAEIGVFGQNNTVIVTNGGRLITGVQSYIGGSTYASNETVVVTGAGSLWQSGSTFYIGSNTAAGTFGINGRATISDGGTLDAPALVSGLNGSGSISNINGIYQFPLFNPTITPNTAGSIMITNGTISFRDIANADVFSDVSGTLNQIKFFGNNTFRLNNASNRSDIAQSYTFDTGRGATNYVGLELVNGNTAWRSANLNIGANGSLLASNTIGTVAALVTNLGSIEMVNSKVTFASNVVVSGRFRSDPSTNTFSGDVTVSQSGTMAGGTGDLFDFKKSFLIHATNNIGFDLAKSAVEFSGGGMHTNAITGMDLGSNSFAYAVAYEQQANFAYGELHLGSSADQICFTCGNIPTAASNGLYVGWLDLFNNASLVTNLHAASGINIYYNETDTRNSYLNAMTYQLTDCNFATGGGFLMPIIPEPSALLLTLAAGSLFIRRRFSSRR